MNWMWRRSVCMALPRSAPMFWPSNSIVPLLLLTSCSSERPVVVLPQPDSPTSDRVSPGYRSKLTFSTACTRFCTRPKMPPVMSKLVVRSRTFSTGPLSRRTVDGCATGAAAGSAWRAASSTLSSGNGAGSSVPCMAPRRGTADSKARV
ncbi:Uncharacterised protein [Achromobacter ruhlandii]|nr:Uncharacterised protein [Achromobacter ruhlandii]